MYKLFTGKVYSPPGYIKKILLVMRLIMILLTTAILQVNANGFAQKISISAKNASLKSVLAKVNKQTGYGFIYDESVLNRAKPVNLELKNVTLEAALNACFDGQPLAYSLEGKTIVLREKTPTSEDKNPELLRDLNDIVVSGRVLNEKGVPLIGVNITVKGISIATTTNESGYFSIAVPDNNSILNVSFVGYKSKQILISKLGTKNLIIVLELSVSQLETVNIVSTGYQTIPKERATGSFETVNNQLFNRTTGSDIFSRLEGVVPGILFDKRPGSTPNQSNLSIRGISTLSPQIAGPLVVIDNFPYDGDLNNINPNDVESITILKDAAAASIWGARAGNGVVVVTTKKGKYGSKLQIDFNSNLTVIEKPNLLDLPQISSSEVIDVEKMLFEQGYYDDKINDIWSRPLLSPVVELLAQTRPPDNTISLDEANAQINLMRNYNLRKDYLKYVYRKQFNQQYALNFSGGTDQLNYFASVGYDRNSGRVVSAMDDRLNFRTSLNFKPMRKLELQLSSVYTQSLNKSPGDANLKSYPDRFPPYTRLADESGNPLAIGRDFRTSFIDTVGNGRLLDWKYRPLSEISASSEKQQSKDLLLNIGAKYNISSIFSAEVKYQFETSIGEGRLLSTQDSYYTRNLINLYTQPPGSEVEMPIPLGGILNLNNTKLNSYNIRGQINADKAWGKNRFSAIGGLEARQNHTNANNSIFYGYDDDILVSKQVNFNQIYPLYNFLLPDDYIPNSVQFSDIINRYTSIYSNAAYNYDNRYTISASVRKDASNLFGVKTNQKGVPLWSVGGGWNIANESFYRSQVLPDLKFRLTYGYQGNTNSSLAAYSTIQYRDPLLNTNGRVFAAIRNPKNEGLRWEKVRQLNIGVDFGFKNKHITGSLEYYQKKATDVLSLIPLDLTTGFNSATVNNAILKVNGLDFTVNTDYKVGPLRWLSNFILGYNNNKVQHYQALSPISSSLLVTATYGVTPVINRPAYAIYSYKWAGLNPETGSPRGILNNEISENYDQLTKVGIDDLEYHGSTQPVYFGAFRNTFSWKGIEISANIIYKFDYYFRRSGINYGTLFESGRGHSDYTNRWQKPGDEKITDIPALTYPANTLQQSFYSGSSALVSKGDHIRLQDITASYTLKKPEWQLKNVRLYANVNNIGILWRANKQHLDPDYTTGLSTPLSFAIGLNANF